MKKIPDHAKKVFEGVIFDVYQWEQEMYDGSTEIFEKLRRPNTLLVLALVDGKIMIARDEQPDRGVKLGVPGGRQDPGETPEEGIMRELLEETGYTTDTLEHFLSVQPTNKIDWNIHTYIARDCKKVAEQMLDAGEKIEIEFVDFDGFIEAAMSEDWMETHLQMLLLRMKGDYTEFRKLLGV